MNNELKPYDEYKESGMDWIGKIPSHWNICRNKSIFKEINLKSDNGLEELLCVSQYTGVTKRKNRVSVGKGLLTNAETLVGYKKVSKDDLVMNIMLAWNGSLGVSKYDGIVSPAYCIYRMSKKQNSYYFHYLLRTNMFTGIFKTLSTGVIDSRLRLYPDSFFRLYSIVPPLDEQDQIVKYLDFQLAKINKFIKSKKKLIEVLKEQKQAVINEAVTKGINPNVKMKPSGIEWLGDIPEHWVKCKLKHLGKFKSGEGITSLEIDKKGEYPVYGGNGLRGYFNKYTHDGSYLLIGRQGALCGNIHLVRGKFWASEHAVVVTTNANVDIYWAEYLIETMNLNKYSQSAAQPGLAVEKIINIYTILPPIAEQQKIVEYVKQRIEVVDKSIYVIEKEIELITEYRTCLISDVVTGKVDVRHIEIDNIIEEDTEIDEIEDEETDKDEILDNEDE